MRHQSLQSELEALLEKNGLEDKSVQELNTIYLQKNLEYISLCEANADLHYMPSARYDAQMTKSLEKQEVKPAAKILSRRLSDILRCLKEVD